MENENITGVLAGLVALVSEIAETTANLVEQGASTVAPQYVASIRDKANSLRQKAMKVREALSKLHPSGGL